MKNEKTIIGIKKESGVKSCSRAAVRLLSCAVEHKVCGFGREAGLRTIGGNGSAVVFRVRLHGPPSAHKKEPLDLRQGVKVWALTDSNRRPSACKADALNQLS